MGNLLLVVFLSLFMLVDKDSILAYFNRIVPPQWSDEALLFETSVASSFGGFIRGQVGQGVVMAIVAVVVQVVFGLDFTPVSAAVTGILQTIPFFGPAFAWLPPVFIALLTKPDVVLPVTIAMLVGWFVVNNVLAPRLMATAVGIHPVAVLVSVLIGLKVAGVAGAIFAVPVAAVAASFFHHFLNRSAAPRDVTTRAAKVVEQREGRRVRVPKPPMATPEPADATPPTTAANSGRRQAGHVTTERRRSGRRRSAEGLDVSREAQRVERRDVDREQGEPLAAREQRRHKPRATTRQARPLSEWPTRPRILVTNDDGIESRGLLALKQALDPLGEVYVLAPETNQSAVGHTKTFMRPLRVRERTLADGAIGWSVDGSPTDAVSLAFLGYFEVGFDLVASGINYGANLGDDITYSGTVSAAMEAVLSAVPAIAISQEYYQHPDFTLAARAAYRAAVNVLERGLGPGELININVPAIRADECLGVEVTRLGKRIYQDELVRRLDPRGTPYYWIGGPPPSGVAEEGTDFHAVVNKRIAITPIQLDLTARRLLGRLNSWPWDLPGKGSDVPAAAEPTTRTDKRQDEVVTAQAEPKDELR